MEYIYYDSRITGKRNSPRRELDTEVVLTFSPLTGRVYFTTGAVLRFRLKENRVSFVQAKNDPTALFLFVDNKLGFRLTTYRWANYVNCKRAVQQTMDLFEGDAAQEPRRFRVNEEAELVDGHKMYRLAHENN